MGAVYPVCADPFPMQAMRMAASSGNLLHCRLPVHGDSLPSILSFCPDLSCFEAGRAPYLSAVVPILSYLSAVLGHFLLERDPLLFFMGVYISLSISSNRIERT